MQFSHEEKKKMYDEVMQKQNRYFRRVFLLIFGVIGLLFVVMGSTLWICGVQDEDGFMPGVFFTPFGLFFLLLGTLVYFLSKHESWNSYERYLARTEKQGYVNTNDLYITLALQEKRIEALEQEVTRLRAEKGQGEA